MPLPEWIGAARTTRCGVVLTATPYESEYVFGDWKAMLHEPGAWGVFDFATNRLGHFRTFRECRWWITRRLFWLIAGEHATGDVETILRGTTTPGEWMPFRVLADKLDDLGAADAAAAARRLIPRKL